MSFHDNGGVAGEGGVFRGGQRKLVCKQDRDAIVACVCVCVSVCLSLFVCLSVCTAACVFSMCLCLVTNLCPCCCCMQLDSSS